ncbi:LysR family transcriptional regulator [Kribbella solani]|uniref:DNA-binding transcriptional LysR family regulator n=1 Tax=Kribbella solani TaxID=236067 RepID=A0A841DJU0_9ACTN|nr:LysR family transcriptional regulator [Kribbella solani]MBB5977879.1 DNA-binding transcriptional LysR family regulator [Kribbella solani]MDX2969209.1 LysR family transcriptional regulator [Kribbella solani]MDX3006322.1 LysR family transcriptional regulator [Kribbella solani]
MDLTMLRQFVVIARLEHLSRAADELHVAQPSLSRTVARLEHELGTPLFDRSGRLRLNPVGALFRDYVERALGELDAGRRAVAAATEQGTGTVRLGAENFLALTEPLATFKRDHPTIELELRQLPAEDMPRRLRAQEVDFCVASQPVATAGLESFVLLDEPVWVVTPLDHSLAGRTSVRVEELADELFVTGTRSHWQRNLLDRLFAELGLTPRVVCESDEAAAIQELIRAGLGIGFNPDLARRSMPDYPVAWLQVEHPACRRTLTLLWHANQPLTPAAQQVHTTITTWPWSPAS